MLQFVFRRLLQAIPILLAVAGLIFLLFSVIPGNFASTQISDGRAVMDDSDCAVLRNDLLLEALLTAPFGQLSHFEPSPGGVLPVYASEPPDPALHASIELVHRGIEDFINDVGTVIGDAITKLSFDPVLVQRPLECLGSGLWRMPTGFDGLAAEDRHSGRGQVPVA